MWQQQEYIGKIQGDFEWAYARCGGGEKLTSAIYTPKRNEEAHKTAINNI